MLGTRGGTSDPFDTGRAVLYLAVDDIDAHHDCAVAAGAEIVIQAPTEGTVALDNGVEGAFVTAGTQLAVAYDLSEIFVTARVEETAIGDVHLGQQVDIAVDAHPDTTFTGYVWEIQDGARRLPATHAGDPGEDRNHRPEEPHPRPRDERHYKDPQELTE
ncbi:MAG: efflux RND transporter periplasmic adaptor subunit [Pseudonocardiaceae bacterium]